MIRPDPAPSSCAFFPAWVSDRLIGLTAFAFSWAILAWRRPDQWTAPQFWAEDGCIFFNEAVTLGWASLIKSYAGYLHTAPRIIAIVTSWVRWEYMPTVYVLLASAGGAWVGMRVATARLPLLERLLAMVAVVVLPHSGEAFLNITNLQWMLNAILVVILLEPPLEKATGMVWRVGELLFVGLSSPMVIVLSPFAALWIWRWRKSSFAWSLFGAWVFAMIVQGLFLFSSDRGVGTSIWTVIGDLHWVVPRYAAELFVGQWYPYSIGLGWTVMVGVVLAAALLFSERTNERRLHALLLLLAAVATLVAGRLAWYHWANPTGQGARYAYLPFMLVMWTWASLAGGTRRPAYRFLALTLFSAVVWSSAAAWQAAPPPPRDWPQQVREAQAGQRARFEVAPNFYFDVPAQPKQSR